MMKFAETLPLGSQAKQPAAGRSYKLNGQKWEWHQLITLPKMLNNSFDNVILFMS